jgi:membrane-associated protease RseP (regulator of RpoE activity)
LEDGEQKRVEFQYGFLLVRTRRFAALMDKLGGWRTTKPLSWVLLALMPIAAVVIFYLYLILLAAYLSPRGAAVASAVRGIGPLANLGLPGVNPYIPIFYGIAALIIGVVLHEGAHGVFARAFGIRVKASGLLFFLFIPIGAFVDVDENELRTTKASYSGRILAGGAGVNFVVAIVSLLLLVAAVGAMVPAASGAGITGVTTGSPAYNAGIRPGDIITQLDGHNLTDLSTYLGPNTNFTAGQAINLTVYTDGKYHAVNNVTLACCEEIINTTNNQVIAKYPYIGVDTLPEAGIVALPSQYANLADLVQYLCIPTFPNCQSHVPFSGGTSSFYTSPLGWLGPPVMNLLYWIFFLNLNLAGFNALPIYPLDGGQAFRVGVKALGRGKMSEVSIMRITAAATFIVLAILLGVILAPYIIGAIAG